MKKWLKRALGGHGREKAEKLVTAGVVHAREGRLDEALRSYESAAAADDTLAVAQLNVGLCRLDLFNRDAKALDEGARARALHSIVEALERAFALDARASAPSSADTSQEEGAPLTAEHRLVGWRALARVYERRHAWAKADDAWKRVEDAAVSPPGQPDSPARTEAKKAREALGKRADADRARGRALSALAAVDALDGNATVDERRDALDALDALVPHLDLRGDQGEAIIVRGAALAGTLARRAGDAARARALLERAANEEKEDVEALRELASVCLENGDLKRALSASMEAYRALPTDAGLVCNVGVCHLGLGDLEEAAEFIELAHRLEPKDPIIARAIEALGQARKPT